MADLNLTMSDLFAARMLLSKRLHERFIQYCWQRREKFLVGYHTRKICNRIDKAMADYKEGKSTFLTIKVPFRHGKLLSDDTPVITPDGYRNHGDLQCGDFVYNERGDVVSVIAVSPVGRADREVEFSDGCRIKCNGKHEWVVWAKTTGNVKRCKIFETDEMLRRGLEYACGNYKFAVDHASVIRYDEKKLPIHPYILGYWLGNGSTSKNCITYDPRDYAVVDRFISLGYERFSVNIHSDTGVHTTYFTKLYKDLVGMKLLGDKHIPFIYKYGSVEQRLQLVAGLIDSDGYAAEHGKMVFSNTNKGIIDDIVEILRSLGCTVGVSVYPPKVSSSGIHGRLSVYQVCFYIGMYIPVVLPRKQVRSLSVQRRRSIVSIKKIKPVRGKCIQVDGGIYLAGDRNVPTHNSDIVSRYLPPHFLGENPDAEVIVAGYSAGLTAEFSKFARKLIKSRQYSELYPGIRLAKDEQSVDVWGLHGHLGKVHWVGLGGSITGKGGNCFVAGTKIRTDIGDIEIDRLSQLYSKVCVVSVEDGRLVLRRIEAFKETLREDIYEVGFEDGSSFRCTGDHRIWIERRGWTEAKSISSGEEVCSLREGVIEKIQRDMLGLLSEESGKVSGSDMCAMREEIFSTAVRGNESEKEGIDGSLLFDGVSGQSYGGEMGEEMCILRDSYAGEETQQILFEGMLGESGTEENSHGDMSMVRTVVPEKMEDRDMLFERMCKSSSYDEDDRFPEFSLQRWLESDTGVSGNAPFDSSEGQWEMSRMREDRREKGIHVERIYDSPFEYMYSSYGRGYHDKRSGKSGIALYPMSSADTSFKKKSVSYVRRISTSPVPVYDIQVEKSRCFFANEVLVHNCIIVDDFFKGREEAESKTMRDKVWESFADDILTRRAPVCIVIVLATPWHCDDLFGRINDKMNEDPMFPRFEEIRFPARDEKYKKIHTSEYLFPERFDDEWYLSQYATLGPYSSAGLLDCSPVVRHGNLYDVSKIRYYDGEIPVKNLTWSRGWDLASTTKQRISDDPDYTASIKLGVGWLPNPAGEPMPVLYIDDFTIDRMEAPKRDEKIKRISKSDSPIIQVGVEAYGPYKDAFTNLQTALWGIRTVHKIQLPGDKVTKASILEPVFSAGNVWMRKASWNTELIRYLSEFPGGKHDDPVDALVAAYAVHKPYVKSVLPHMQSVVPITFNIKWDLKEERQSLHYGAVVLKRDLSMWVVCALWDDIAGQLFVYDATSYESPDIPALVKWLTWKMHLKKYSVDRIMCNDRMCKQSDGTEKTMMQLCREEGVRQKVHSRFGEAVRYDQWGSLSQLDELARDRRIFFDEVAEEALVQMQLWSVEKNKPSTVDAGYCEAMTLIVSELKRKSVFEKKYRRKDYMKEKAYQELKSRQFAEMERN